MYEKTLQCHLSISSFDKNFEQIAISITIAKILYIENNFRKFFI